MTLTKRALIIVALAAGLIAFMAYSNPQDLAIGLMLVPFIFFAAIVYNTVRFLAEIFRYRPDNQLRQKVIALVFSVVFTNFAVLQSIGRLTPQDLIIALVITVLISIYISRFQIPSR